ncbi:hypothetical protein NE237_007545 [Protea cynaroides]|uniref:Uncharacterized protein n=1 Tax=Protea cynaroides TaxID=273540 RepID=A0A9Q0KQ92_9MAGN|nr:hypothetical protein NE237_007545 [Protea cynaroides]
MVDTGSSADIIYWQAFRRMEIPLDRLLPIDYPLVSFSGDLVSVKGSIRLLVRAGTYPRESRVTMNFLVVDVPSSYNGLLGRPSMIALRSVPSPYHLVLKFLTPRGVGEYRSISWCLVNVTRRSLPTIKNLQRPCRYKSKIYETTPSNRGVGRQKT